MFSYLFLLVPFPGVWLRQPFTNFPSEDPSSLFAHPFLQRPLRYLLRTFSPEARYGYFLEADVCTEKLLWLNLFSLWILLHGALLQVLSAKLHWYPRETSMRYSTDLLSRKTPYGYHNGGAAETPGKLSRALQKTLYWYFWKFSAGTPGSRSLAMVVVLPSPMRED